MTTPTLELSRAGVEAYRQQGPAARNGSEERYFCPIHGGDHQRSLAVNCESGAFHCHSCGASGILADYRKTDGDSLAQLAGFRGWTPAALVALGARSLNGCAIFPMRDAAGVECGFKRRRATNEPFSGGQKSLTNTGGKAGLFYAMPLPTEGTALVVEGEADTAAALSAGWEASVGTAGSNPGPIGKAALAALLRGRDVVLAPDPDDAGAKWLKAVCAVLSKAGCEVRVIAPDLENKRDLDARLRNEPDRPAALRTMIEKAEAWKSSAPAVERGINTTDCDNADRLVRRHGDDFLYCAPWKQFLVWDKRRWSADGSQQIERWGEETARAIFDEAKGVQDETVLRRIVKWGLESRSDFRLKAMLNRAKPKRAVAPDEMDPASTNWFFNVANGVIDLKTGNLLPHDRARRITRLSDITYDPAALCPCWEGVLNRSLGGNQALIDYFARAVGYSMIGQILERVIFILWGLGRNGKTVIRETLSALFGDYGAGTPITTFLEKPSGGIPNDLARLRGVRFVSASEAEEGARLAPALIKQVTGGDTVTARFLHAEFFDYRPAFKAWLATNHRPEIPGGGDQALWDRIHLVPFKIQIPPDEMIPLAELLGVLRAEMPGILTWAVRGCLSYQEQGLNPPKEVRAAVGDYRTDQDVLADFLDAECVAGPGCMVYSLDLFKRYTEWAGRQGIARPMIPRSFGKRLVSHGFDRGKDSMGRFWIGLSLQAIPCIP